MSDFHQKLSAFFSNVEEVIRLAKILHYPLLIIPSFVSGACSMRIVSDDAELVAYLENTKGILYEHPLLMENYIDIFNLYE